MSDPEKTEKKARGKRTNKTINLDMDNPKYRITFTPTWQIKQKIKAMINARVAKNITDAVCECIKDYKITPHPDLKPKSPKASKKQQPPAEEETSEEETSEEEPTDE